MTNSRSHESRLRRLERQGSGQLHIVFQLPDGTHLPWPAETPPPPPGSRPCIVKVTLDDLAL